MWMYCVCGVAVAHVGLGFFGFGCTPRASCTVETSRLHLQHPSTLSTLPAHYYQDLMGLSCPRGLRPYHPPCNNGASRVAVIEILYWLSLHYSWHVAEFSLGACKSCWHFMTPCLDGHLCTTEDYLVFELRFLWQVQRCTTLFSNHKGKSSRALFADLSKYTSVIRVSRRNVWMSEQRDQKHSEKFRSQCDYGIMAACWSWHLCLHNSAQTNVHGAIVMAVWKIRSFRQ